MRRVAPLLAAAVAATACVWSVSAAAEEGAAGPLKLRVNPSGYEARKETLAEKVARRDRESEYRLRWICRGCLPPEIEARANAPAPPQPGPEAAVEAAPIR